MEKTKEVRNWKELINFIKEIDPYRNTITMSGFVNKITKEGKLELDVLIFTSNLTEEEKFKEEYKVPNRDAKGPDKVVVIDENVE